MKQYFYMENNERKGPFTIDELSEKFIFSDTLVTGDALDGWEKAADVAALSTIVRQKFSKENESEDSFGSSIDYRRVEDLAGVDYKKAMVFTAIYIVMNVFFRQYAVLGKFGILLSTTSAILVWWYFKKYFDAIGDKSTGFWAWGMIAAYGVFGFVCFIAADKMGFWDLAKGAFTGGNQTGNLVENGMYLSIVIILVSGGKMILARKKHAQILNWVAITTMVLIPFYINQTIYENIAVLNQIKDVGSVIFGVSKDDGKMGFFASMLFMTPYFLLLYHFYRAESEDATNE